MNENRKRNWRRWLLGIALLITGLAVLATGTAAYFTTEETANNVITTGVIDLELVELTTGDKPWPTEGVKDVMPGMTVDKRVFVRNNGSAPLYARLRLSQSITPAEGIDAELNFDHISLDINLEHWTEQDGFYYYYRALQPGESSEPLLTKVVFDPAMGNEYMDATVHVNVLAQAVQSDNNGEDPLKADGWSEVTSTVVDAVHDTVETEQN